MSAGVDPLVRVTVAFEDGSEVPALTRRSGSSIELLPADGTLPTLDVGQRLGLKRPIAGDATYEEPVVVHAVEPDGAGVLVRPAGERRRHQQRDHVRVTTLQLRMTLTRLDAAAPADGAVGDAATQDGVRDGAATDSAETRIVRVVDLSAGGARVEHDGAPLPPGSRWLTEVTLPYDDGQTMRLEQVAEVRWQTHLHEDAPATSDADWSTGDDGWPDLDGPPPTTAGLRFVDIRPGAEASVTRWVFQQQAKWLRVRRSDR